ncbi:MAG: helix-turn-helix transcriptional regulator [Nitrososphaerales archaeon]
MNLRSVLGNTKSKVFNHLTTRKHTAGEVAAKLDIQVTAARKHLESLRQKGLIKEEYITEGVGRPKKFYTLTGVGRELLQNQSSTLLNLVLTKIAGNHEMISADDLISHIAKEIAEPMRVSGFERNEQVVSLVASLDKFGFETSLEEDKHSYTIISHHCPLKETANSHQNLVCHGLHDGIIKSALGTDDLKLETCIALGDSMCRHVIQKQR